MRSTIFKRLVIGNMIMLSFLVSLGAYVIYKLDVIQQLTQDIVDTDTKSINHCENLSSSLLSMIVFEKKYIISQDIDYHKKYMELKDEFEAEMGQLQDILKLDEIKKYALDAQALFINYSAFFADEVKLIDAKSKDYDPTSFFEKRSNIANQIEEKLERIIGIKNEVKMKKLVLSSLMIGQSIKLTVTITIIALFLGILLSVTNTRAITGSIFLLERKTREISKGQFNHIPSIASAPKEIEDLTQHFNVMCNRLKELEVMKTDFISHFSHELRTPVTSIKAASSMLNMKLFDADPQKEKELSQLILTECDRLIKSIEKILDLSKMEVYKMEWEFSPSDVVEVIEKALAKFRPVAQNKEIDLVFLPGKEIPKTLLDEKRIEEVINNLVSNALKFTLEKGNIIIEVQAGENKEKIIVSVDDNGRGIDEKDLDSIFEKFKRIDIGNETLRGTGLGLSISKHIINAHKGEIWAESEIFKGTKVCFTLPVV